MEPARENPPLRRVRPALVVVAALGVFTVAILIAIYWRWRSDIALADHLDRIAAAIRQRPPRTPAKLDPPDLEPVGLLELDHLAQVVPHPLGLDRSGPNGPRTFQAWLDSRNGGGNHVDRRPLPERIRTLSLSAEGFTRFSIERVARKKALKDLARRALNSFAADWLSLDPAPDYLAERMTDLAIDLRDRRRMRVITHDRVAANEFSVSAELRYLQYRVWGDSKRRVWASEALGLSLPIAGVSAEVPSIPLDRPRSETHAGMIASLRSTEDLGLLLVAWSLESGRSLEETATNLRKLSPNLQFDLRLGRRELEIRDRRLQLVEPLPRRRTIVMDPTDERRHTVIAGTRD